jgi:hypothetical protein
VPVVLPVSLKPVDAFSAPGRLPAAAGEPRLQQSAIRGQLDWHGPTGRPQGHIVLTRMSAKIALDALSRCWQSMRRHRDRVLMVVQICTMPQANCQWVPAGLYETEERPAPIQCRDRGRWCNERRRGPGQPYARFKHICSRCHDVRLLALSCKILFANNIKSLTPTSGPSRDLQ